MSKFSYLKTIADCLVSFSVFLFFVVVFTSCKGKISDGMLVITEIPYASQNDDAKKGTDDPQPRIIAVKGENSVKEPEILTKEFYAASSPEISYDGTKMIFSARQNKDDLWQIWEMELKNSHVRKIFFCNKNCTGPAYLPGNKCVFSMQPDDYINNAEQALFVCNLDGTGLKQVTFHPYADYFPTILRDGRILMISRQLYPEPSDQTLMVMRPDGTKALLYYNKPEGKTIKSRPWENAEGQVFFIEYDSLKQKGNIIEIHQNHPLHSRKNLSENIDGSFGSVFPLQNGKIVVSYRAEKSGNYDVYEFDPEGTSVGRLLFSHQEKYRIAEVNVVAKRNRPRDLPSEVDESFDSGLLLCQDINTPDITKQPEDNECKKACRVRLCGIDGTLGEVNVEDDGSFQLKILADTPFRIFTLDESGKIADGPSSWMWIRPNERRGFVGFHADPEMAPVNRIPLAVKKPPIPVTGDSAIIIHRKHIVE